jgi:hypothetical protein
MIGAANFNEGSRFMQTSRAAAWITGVMALAAAGAAPAQQYSRTYEAPKLDSPIVIDGVLDDAGWQTAPLTDPYVTYGTLADVPVTATRARIAWDEQYLYVGVEAEDHDIWSTFTDRDANTWDEDVLEVFLDPEGDAEGYLEFEVSPRNTIFDSWIEKPLFSQGGPSHVDWNAAGLLTAVSIDGTLGGKIITAERRDTDQGWSLEFALPWSDAAIVSGVMALPPDPGDTWRINVCRYDYRRTSSGPELSQWSPSAVSGAWHTPSEYGYVTFTALPTSVESSTWARIKALW